MKSTGIFSFPFQSAGVKKGKSGGETITVNDRKGDEDISIDAGEGDDTLIYNLGDGEDWISISGGGGDDTLTINANNRRFTLLDDGGSVLYRQGEGGSVMTVQDDVEHIVVITNSGPILTR